MRKESLRTKYLKKRKEIPHSTLVLLNESIHNFFKNDTRWHLLEHFHLYLPILKQNEVDTWSIVEYLQNRNKAIYIPKVFGNELRHYLFGVLKKNQWGILEPIENDAQTFPPHLFDVIIVPLVIFDTFGHRIGYGKGYYDRFLASCRADAIKIGLSFFEPIHKISDTKPHDIPLDVVITPFKIWNFSRKTL